MIASYIAQGEYTLAANSLVSYQNNYAELLNELRDKVDEVRWMQLVLANQQQGTWGMELSQASYNEMKDLADNSSGRAALKAQNYLNFFYDAKYSPIIEDDPSFLLMLTDDPCDAILAVELIDFWATHIDNGVLLEWATASEIDHSYFEVQRSSNGEDFRTLERVFVSDDSNTRRDYEYLDRTPNKGDNYYRLKIVDDYGSVSYSTIRQVYIDVNFTPFQIYPNPFNESFFVIGDITINHRIRILDINGRVVLEEPYTNGNVNLPSSIQPGLYYLVILSERQDILYREKLMKM